MYQQSKRGQHIQESKPSSDTSFPRPGGFATSEPEKNPIAAGAANLATRDGAREVGINSHSIEHGNHICETSRCNTPDSSSSGAASMVNHKENATPPQSPSNSGSPGAITTQGIGRLSLYNEQGLAHSKASSGLQTTASKRPASSDLPRESNKHPSVFQGSRQQRAVAKKSTKAKATVPRETSSSVQQARFDPHGIPSGTRWKSPEDGFAPRVQDSEGPSVPTTTRIKTFPDKSMKSEPPAAAHGPSLGSSPPGPDRRTWGARSRRKSSDLILQPESSPISTDQLAAEVKGIYAGLVMVEAKCIHIDNAQAADPHSKLGPEQWQALIALHRTLLYEHHDFLMATQHPSATVALRGLATKYSMPARMWKHGIHAFLEVLRHRRPESQDYMLAFIYLAYQMMALLYETVPTFLDTWIECLGDLARYRMAIEEEREAHGTWGGVAGRWYRLAADKQPMTGRLNHHLGILERPSLRKLFLYTKSLTCVIPFPNARDSLATLSGPIVQDEQIVRHGTQTAEARIVTLYALFFSGHDENTMGEVVKDTLIRLGSQPGSKIREIGVDFAVTAVGFILELGATSNGLWQMFTNEITEAVKASRPSFQTNAGSPTTTPISQEQSSVATTFANALVYTFCYQSFNLLLRHRQDRQSLRDVLPSVHVVLVWIHGISTVQSRNKKVLDFDMFSSLLGPDVFCWGELSEYLNKLSQAEPITARIIEFARQGIFLTPERVEDGRPLPEDFSIRGLIWTHFYYPSNFFNGPIDDEGRAIETAAVHKARVERVQWLGLYLAFRSDYLKFDPSTRSFFSPVSTTMESMVPPMPHDQPAVQPTSTPSRSSTTVSSDSDGYGVVTSPGKRPDRPQTKTTPRTTKSRPHSSPVKVLDEESMQWEQGY